MPNVVDDGHDRSSHKIPLPSTPLSVFFIDRYLVLREPCLVRRTITDGDEIYTGLGPQEASKSLTSSCYSCIACIRRDCCYNVAMPMKESVDTTGDIATFLYLGSTWPTS